jgi:rubredoxin
MTLRTRVVLLERILPPPRPPTREEVQRERYWKKIERRLIFLVQEAEKLLTEAESEQISAVENDCKDDRNTPFDGWLRDLQWGRSRLPEITGAVMKALVSGWFHSDLDSFSSVCNQCGLQYPRLKTPPPHTWKVLPGKIPRVDPPPWYDLPEIFKVCPHCGASARDVTYSHLTEDMDLPWKALDGWMRTRG